MWADIEARIAENDLERPNARRRELLDVLRTSGLVPNGNATKYMVAFLSEGQQVVVWELTGAARNIFVADKWQDAVEQVGLECERKAFVPGLQDGGRHSGLNRPWSFPQAACLRVKIDDNRGLRRLIGVITRGQRGQVETIDRRRVEAAMDALDARGEGGQPDKVADSPPASWVRSTRIRPNRVFPARAVASEALGTAGLSDGWGEGAHAAALLHNAGFIIVTDRDVPVPPPEFALHLLRDADRIRLCALNYFVEPAREQGAAEVAIRAGDLAAAMGLKDAFPNVCQALGGEKFRQLARVPAPTATEPNPSSTTTFTFRLKVEEVAGPVAETAVGEGHPATNLILYGPPGTGKTYRTAFEAVRLCLDAERFAQLEGQDRRVALMAEYQRLVAEGRIEFITFHQSMSYEEFIEGLRPDRGEDAVDGFDEPDPKGGFQLKPHDGVFKRFSERARLDRRDSGTAARLDRSARVFKVALGRRGVEEDRIRYGLENELIHVGWGGDIDWSDQRFESYNDILSEWRSRKDSKASGHDGNIVITFSLRADMQTGDYVVLSDGRDRVRAFGRISGEYFYDQDASFHPHRRRVTWLWRSDQGVERELFYPNVFRRHSLYKLDQSLVDWDALEAIVCGPETASTGPSSRAYVLIVDEINRANISKVFGELITLLEPDKRIGMANEIRLVLPYSKKSFGVPANLHIVGTMNTADRSIALLDTALRRRFAFRELVPRPECLPTNLEGVDLAAVLRTLNARIEYLVDREHCIGHAFFMGCRTRADIDAVMRDRVIPLLAEYFFEDWDRIRLVLGETTDAGAFLARVRLEPPPGLEDAGPERWRYAVHDTFGAHAYTQLQA
ncbi:AAA family ATPase [Methylobacterium segetis]|uniref:AAA family ATPase n=1 Tax=Methylobacterium segetis TaxID=2488750 RepID=UPI001FE10FB1|nr:AAA family ATPase [Methylobacterium segetis]